MGPSQSSTELIRAPRPIEIAMSKHEAKRKKAGREESAVVEIYVPTIIYYSPPEEGERILKELGEVKEECRE